MTALVGIDWSGSGSGEQPSWPSRGMQRRSSGPVGRREAKHPGYHEAGHHCLAPALVACPGFRPRGL